MRDAETPPPLADDNSAGSAVAAPAATRPLWEKAALGVVILALVALRVVYLLHYRVDSDEPQHLHVVWGWANGLLQYRDIFDNHSPLFQMLCAPFFLLFSERADIVIPMRVAMQPLYLFDLWCIYRIARRLGSSRFALWTTIAAAFYPVFFFVSTEFRTDDLWVALWLWCLALIANGEFAGRRAFWIGVVLGASFAVSMKSSLLAGSLVLGGVVCFILHRRFGGATDGRRLGTALGLALLGVLVIPGLVIGYFATQHALPVMYQCVITHNTAIGADKLHKFAFKRFWFPISLIVCPILGYYLLRFRGRRPDVFLQVFLLSCAAFYYNALRSFWPLITDQDYLPLAPVAIVGFAPLISWLAGRPFVSRVFGAPTAFAGVLTALILVGEIRWMTKLAPPRDNQARGSILSLGAVLRLTTPTDYVMDGKGETIYRKRPFYYVLEGVTIKRIGRGLIKDDVVHSLIEKRVCVVLRHRLPKADDAWVEQHYVADADKVWVAGSRLGPVQKSISFTTVIPADYTVISSEGGVTGLLDGKPLQASQFLEPGQHELQITSARGQLAVVWARAVERGFSLFVRKKWDGGGI